MFDWLIVLFGVRSDTKIFQISFFCGWCILFVIDKVDYQFKEQPDFISNIDLNVLWKFASWFVDSY